MKKKYCNHSHIISEKKFRQILKFFWKDYTAFAVSDTTGISRVTVNNLYALFRKRILLLIDSNLLDKEVEIDESYFGAKRVRGKRGRGVKGKTPVVDLLKRN